MGEGDQPALGRGIGFTVRFGLPGTRRGDVEDGPGVFAQGGQGVFAAQEGAMQAGEAALPLGQRPALPGSLIGRHVAHSA